MATTATSSSSSSSSSTAMSLDDTGDLMVTLVCKEGEEFQVPEKAARQSQLVVDTLKNSEDRKVPLPTIDRALLTKVIEYLNHHATEPPRRLEPPVRTSNFRELVSEYDYQFMAVCDDAPNTTGNAEKIWDFVLAANFMHIKSLLDLCCAKLATMIRGKKTEELRKLFGIANDFTPEEEQQLIEENKWAFE